MQYTTYIDGVPLKASDYQEVKTDGPKFFSMDWGGLVALGYDDEKTPKYQALGLIDEFYIFPCVLTTDDIAKIKDFCGEYGKKCNQRDSIKVTLLSALLGR